MSKVRLDKWLWAARFFKTRAKAKQAIDGGKVHIGGVRAKSSKELQPGDVLTVRQGWDEKTVTVTGLSSQRRGAVEASMLYEESEDSKKRREEGAAERKALAGSRVVPDNRPTKKQRRQIHKFRDQNR
jgi:ribosome-associated heat shock protein Hsp15